MIFRDQGASSTVSSKKAAILRPLFFLLHRIRCIMSGLFCFQLANATGSKVQEVHVALQVHKMLDVGNDCLPEALLQLEIGTDNVDIGR